MAVGRSQGTIPYIDSVHSDIHIDYRVPKQIRISFTTTGFFRFSGSWNLLGFDRRLRVVLSVQNRHRTVRSQFGETSEMVALYVLAVKGLVTA